MDNTQPELRNVLSESLTEFFSTFLYGEASATKASPKAPSNLKDDERVATRVYADWQILAEDTIDPNEYLDYLFKNALLDGRVRNFKINAVGGENGFYYVNFVVDVDLAKDQSVDKDEARFVLKNFLNQIVHDSDVDVRFFHEIDTQAEALAALRKKLTEPLSHAADEMLAEINRDRFDIPAQQVDPSVQELNTLDLNPGKHLCYDDWSGRYFYGSMEFLEASVARVNEMLLREGDVDLNAFYDEVGLSPIPMGTDFGWSEPIRLIMGSIVSPNGAPAICMSFRKHPKPAMGR